jgi:AcrR family transcriptional regulator
MPTPPTRPAGRPRQFDVDDALARALDLFWRNGYRTTTTRELEAGLGITQSSLYHAFGSKARLLDAVLDRYQAAVERSLLQPLRSDPDGLAGLVTFFRDVGAWMAVDGRGCLMVNLMAEEAPDDPAIADRTRTHRDRVRAALRTAIARACPAADRRTVDQRADLLLAATLGVNIAARSGALPAELSRIVSGIQAQIRTWT